MYKITYYIGCNDIDTLKRELPDTQIISVIACTQASFM